MPQIIKYIIMNYDTYWAEAMAYMVSVPEVLDVELEENDDSDSAGPSQTQILDLNRDPPPDEDINNPNSVGKKIIHLKEKLKYQKMMQLAILAVTDKRRYMEIMKSESAKPDAIPGYTKDLPRPSDFEIRNHKEENLGSLIEERRINPTAVPRYRIIRAFSLTSLGKERRKITLEAITSLIRQNDPVFRDLYMMCRLAGLFRTIKYPHAYIASVGIDEEYCYLLDVFKKEGFIYKFNEEDGAFWELTPRIRVRTLVRPFLTELNNLD
ncbi:uncharacterized protein LOC126833732 isoform X2 [Adelges cooleyi]|nr:uncharacterized protein LOC126833732 isoform X2 [Adelges cooleyi]